MKIKVLLADDHALIREALSSLLSADVEISEVYQARNGHEAVQLFRKYQPDIAVVDYEMPNFNGIYALTEILKESPDFPVMMLSAHFSRERVMEAIYKGIRGYLPKDVRIEELLEAVKALVVGKTWFKGPVAELAADYLVGSVSSSGRKSNGKMLPELTSREKQVIKLFAEGFTTQEIASQLSISCRTVEVHKSNIYKKLKLKNSVEMLRYALKQDIVIL